MQTFFVMSPLDQFEVTNLIGVNAPIINTNLTLTNLGLYSILVLIVFLGLHFLSAIGNDTYGSQRVVPSR
jgi:F-type H+-transporting ATPase subunit a